MIIISRQNIKYPITEYGVKVKVALMKQGKTQEWLIKELSKATGQYVDSSNLNRVITGRLHSQSLIAGINKILDIED